MVPAFHSPLHGPYKQLKTEGANNVLAGLTQPTTGALPHMAKELAGAGNSFLTLENTALTVSAANLGVNAIKDTTLSPAQNDASNTQKKPQQRRSSMAGPGMGMGMGPAPPGTSES